MFRPWVLNEILMIDRSFSLVFIQVISFFEQSLFRLLLDLYCVIVIKHLAFFTICAKLTMVFTFISSLYSSVSGCGCGFGFEQKRWRIDDLAKKALCFKGFIIAELFTFLIQLLTSLCNFLKLLQSPQSLNFETTRLRYIKFLSSGVIHGLFEARTCLLRNGACTS